MPGLGTVLVDNTTLFGAARALETWPPRSGEWISGSPAVDLTSLMDTLEGVVLHQHLLVDNSSRANGGEPWPELADSGVLQSDLLLDDPEQYAILVRSATTSLTEWIQTGRLGVERARIALQDPIAAVPSIYRNPKEFYELTAHAAYLSKAAAIQFLVPLRELLEGLESNLASYAMFAFRGFYYEELAHLRSISYAPHCWRSPLIDSDSNRGSFRFAEFALDLAVELRRELAQRLNGEFGVGALDAELPLLASYIASQAGRRSELLPIALELRANRKVIAFRRWVEHLETAIATQSDLRGLGAASIELQELLTDLGRELGLRKSPENAGQAIKLKLAVPFPLGVASAERTIHPKIPLAWRRIFRRRTHLLFLRDLTKRALEISPFVVAFGRLPA
ncbi:hypothetical protein LQK93_03502 [Terrabacter sp. BE26]